MIKINRAVEQEKKDLQADLAKQQQQQQTIKEDPIADLQRSLGNGGFGEYLSSDVEISSPTDASEIEADNIAKEVVSNLTTPSSMNTSLGDDVPPSGAGDGISSSGGGDGISRKLSDSLSSSQDGGMIYRSITDKIRDANTVGGIQRSIAHEVGHSADDDTIYRSISVGNVHASGLGHDVVQRKLSGSISSYSNGMGIQRSVKDKIHRHASGSASASNSGGSLSAALGSSSATKMSAPIQRKMEEGFGTSFAGVRIHTDPAANTISRSINADAFTQGSDVYFRSGAYNPGSTSGQTLLAHELTHVVQNNKGIQRRIAPFSKPAIPRVAAIPGRDEREFDVERTEDMQAKIKGFYQKFIDYAGHEINDEKDSLERRKQDFLAGAALDIATASEKQLNDYLTILDDAVALVGEIEKMQEAIDSSRYDFAKILPGGKNYNPEQIRITNQQLTDAQGQPNQQNITKDDLRKIKAEENWGGEMAGNDLLLLRSVKNGAKGAKEALEGQLVAINAAFRGMDAGFGKNASDLSVDAAQAAVDTAQAAVDAADETTRAAAEANLQTALDKLQAAQDDLAANKAHAATNAVKARQQSVKQRLTGIEDEADKAANQNANEDADDRFKLMNQPIFKAYVDAIPKIQKAFSRTNETSKKKESTVREFFGKNAGAITKKAVATSTPLSIDGSGLRASPKGFYDDVTTYKQDNSAPKAEGYKTGDDFSDKELSAYLHRQEFYDLGLQGKINEANEKEANVNKFMMDSVLTINSGAAAVEQILDQKDNAKERKDKIKELNEGRNQDLLHDSRSKGGLAATKSLAGILGTADSALMAATSGINAFASTSDKKQMAGSIKAMKGAAGAIGAAKGIFDMAANSAESAENRKKNEKAEKEMKRLLQRVYKREENNLTGTPKNIVRGDTSNKKFPGFDKIATSTKKQQSLKDNEFLKRYLESVLKIRNNGLRKISIDEIRTVLLLNQSREKSQIEADKKKWAAITNAGMSISKMLKSASGFLGGNLGTSLGLAGAWVSAIFGAIGRRQQAKLAQKEAKKVTGQATIGIVNKIVALKTFPDWYFNQAGDSIDARFQQHYPQPNTNPEPVGERQTINRYCQVYTMLEAANVDMVDFCYAAKKMDDAKESIQIDPDDDWGSDGFEENELKQEKIAFLNLIETGGRKA